MPGKNGMELLKEAKALSPHTVRAVLSGHVDLQDMMVAINQAAIDRFILKPWDNEYLELQMLESLQTHLLLEEKSHLQHLAITDIVTGLTNHRYFQETLIKEIERAERHGRKFSLVMIDVDCFKNYNDTHGHPQGDRALAQIAQVLSSQVRNIDIVSRYGGEEFSMIMPDTDLLAAGEVADRVRKAVENTDWTHTPLTISVGVCEYPTHGTVPSELIETADQALYQAKHAGRNQTVCAGSSS
jgi:diguanylate cyclase (GGDEF)-like protein